MQARRSALPLALFLAACNNGSTAQDASAQDVSMAQDVSSQDVSSQDVSSQDVSSQDAAQDSAVPSDGVASDGPGPAAPCAPGASCTARAAACLGFADNASASAYGLRFSQWTITTPARFNSGLIGNVLRSGMTNHAPDCNLTGAGSINVLLRFDSVAGTLSLGGAQSPSAPDGAYSFYTSASPAIAPVDGAAHLDASGMFAARDLPAVVLPLFLGTGTGNAIDVPLSSANISGHLSADHDCIGWYNSASLDPMHSCQPDATHPQFTDQGTLTGYIPLAAADTFMIDSLRESLCVLLSGDAATYGDSTGHCKRDAATSTFLFHGDWCSATNAAATSTCFDSVRLESTFAASSVALP